ncbi:MAG: O-antigen ligase family protein [Clostridia bacterium]|nr:O-antigen ligase family protein [Clostridia bacterium]
MNLMKIKDSLEYFINSIYFHIFIAVLTLFGNLFSCEIAVLCISFAFVFIGLCICEDMRFILSPILFINFTISTKSLNNGLFLKNGFIVWAIVMVAVLIGFIIFHFIKYKKSFKPVLKSKFFMGYMALFSIYLLNGLFNSFYTVGSFLFVLVMIAMFSIPFFVFGAGIKPSKELKEHFILIMLLTSAIVIIELFNLIVFGDVISNGAFIKERIALGWSTWNGIGAILAVCLPIHFYMAITKEHGYIFFITAIISYVSIALTLSRGSLLVATFISLVCVIIGCIKGKNVKLFRICTLTAIVCATILLIALWDKISTVLSDYLERGFDDNGRFELYKVGIKAFLDHPIFGAGFANIYSYGPITPEFFAISTPIMCHNTIIQILASCGIVGICGYFFHRYQTIRFAFKYRSSLFVIFSALCISALLLTSLLDVHFFITYHILYYSTIICIVEKYISSNNI